MNEGELAPVIPEKHWPGILAGVFLLARFISLASMPFEGLHQYGDFVHYFAISSLPGLPFINYWSEYPPFFPFLQKLINHISGGREHVFTYLFVFIFLLADTANLLLFYRLARRFLPANQALLRAGGYLLALAVFPYSWWYFDPIAVFWTLLSLNLILERRWLSGGAAVGMGIAIKFFPGLALAAAWRSATWKQLLGMVTVSLLPLFLSYSLLWVTSPEHTLASMGSQAGKGSWETVWALLDGNIHTGVFGPVEERLDPGAANRLLGNPAVVPPLVSLVFFAGIGLIGLLRVERADELQAISLVGFAWTLFLLWSPGWSPQWALYLLPLILLTLPLRLAVLFAATLVMTSLLEWPVLLSRGLFQFLWAPIIIRTLILAILCGAWAKIVFANKGNAFPARLAS